MGDAPEVRILTPEECRRRLAGGGVGRIALPTEGAPILRPVNFALHQGHILIRTGDGTILASAERREPVSFEIDGVDAFEHTGWSVIAVGKLRRYEEEREGPVPLLRAWASGAKERLVILEIGELSGIRIPPGRGNR